MAVMSVNAEGLTSAAFRHTTVGQIPEDWIVCALAHLTDLKRPISYGIVQTGPSVHGGIRCLRVIDIDDGRIHSSNMITTTEMISDTYKRTILQAGDLVMPLRGKVGEVAIVGSEIAGSNLTRGVALIAIRPANCAPFIKHFVASDVTRTRLAQFMNGSALQEIPISALRSFEIALPPALTEQEAIAEALSDADALIESLEQLLVKKRQIKQGAMQELLTGQRRLPGFEAKWDEKSLGELFSFTGGHTASRDQLGSHGHCYLHYGDIHTSTKTYIELPGEREAIPKLDIALKKVSPNAMLAHGDVVFLDASEDDEGTSRHVVVSNPTALPFISGLHTIVAKAKSNELGLLYRRHCFQTASVKAQFRFFAVGTKVSGVSKSNIRKITVLVPSTEEQSAIATTLSDMDAELTTLEARLAKTRLLKQGMAQALLTGRIRLV